MLPLHVKHHTYLAGLGIGLLHQLSPAADLSRSGGPLHFISELVTNLELP